MTRPPALRLDRLLSNLGYGARSQVQRLLRQGRVSLDGAALDDPAARIALAPDLPLRLHIDGEGLDPLPGVVLMLNKPVGVTCSHKEAGAAGL